MEHLFTNYSIRQLTQSFSRVIMAALLLTCASTTYAQKAYSQLTRRESLPAPATSARTASPQQTNTVLKTQTEFHCEDGKSYLFQGDGGSQDLQSNTRVYQINITGGTITQVHGQLLSGYYTSINNTGYNIKDNFIWGYVRGTNNVVRIKNDWSTDQYSINGLYDSNEPYNAGDIDNNGIMYLFYGAPNGSSSVIRRVDLNPSSGTYKQKLSSITLSPANDNRYIIDLGWNPKDGNLYGLDGDDGHLYRINIATSPAGKVTDLGDANISAGNPFGAVYFDNEGTLYISQNITGKIYKITNVAGGNHAAVFLRNGPQTNDNDGARCASSPVLLNISGTVFNDADGMVDGKVDGTAVNSLSSNTFYANLVGSNGKVLAATALTNGSYTFSDITPNASYSIVLTNTKGTVGSNPPSTALINGVVNTGENIGTGNGSDGTPNGVIKVTLAEDDVDDVNFGVERLPTADAKTAASQTNPGGTTKVTVPTLTGSDPEDGAYTGTSKTNTIIIQSLPTPSTGILYYNGSPATVDQVITNYDPSLLTVDPADGPVSVTFTYSERDKAGKDSPEAKVTMTFTNPATVSISGTVFNDANGLVDNTVNGTPVSSLTANTFSVNLVSSSTGKVVATTLLTNGTYSFTGVTQSASYSVVLSNTPGVVGNNPPSTALSNGVVNTGENIGTGAGNDGSANGVIAVAVTTSSVSNVNFGVERLPTADPKTASNQPNPGGTTKVTVPTLTGSDPEDGVYNGTSKTNTIIIQSLPTPATGVLYYNGTPVTAGQVITNYDPSLLTVDPADGQVTVSFTYSERDAAGKDSPPATVTMSFAPATPATVSISGTVFNDANGLVDNTVNGTPVSSLTANTFSVNLVSSSTGKVVATTLLTNGTYSFTGVTQSASYSVVLSNTPGVVGNNPPSTALSNGVVNTGENIGTGAGNDGSANGAIAVAVTTSSVSNVNFGVERLPTADPKTAASQPNPDGAFTVTVPTLTGSDPEDGVYNGTSKTNTIVIKTLATNGTLYYNGTPVTLNQVITNYDPDLLTVDPANGAVTVTFTYSERDAAGKDSQPATVTMPFILVPDLTPIIYARPSTISGTKPITYVIDVFELNNVATNGLITVKVSKDAKTTLSFDKTLTSVGGRPVQNSNWTFVGLSGGYYTLTTNTVIPAGGQLSFGLTGTLTPGATSGTLTASVVIVAGSGGEVFFENNSDADKIDYFQQ